MFKTPILFLIFNRPDTTSKVFEQIRNVKPKRLFIAADGPRSDKEGESKVCALTRKIVLDSIDWDCEVSTLFKDKNLGCGTAVSEAITWFFEHVEEGIILEDDCVPNNSFFFFCEKMLEKYRESSEVKHVTGSCYIVDNGFDYIFSKIPFIWGWATWRRAWLSYDLKLHNDDISTVEQVIFKNLQSNKQTTYWLSNFKQLIKSGWNFTWDYQWFYSIWKANGLVIAPTKNLSTNIGFSESATHTTEFDHYLSNLPTSEYCSFDLTRKGNLSLVRENKIFNFYFSAENLNKEKISKRRNSLKLLIRRYLRNFILKIIPEVKNLKVEQLVLETNIDEKAKVHGSARLINSRIGAYSYISTNSVVNNTLIGKFCSIGPNLVSGWGIHPLNGISTSPMFYSTAKQNGCSLTVEDKIEETKPIIIGNDVFIGMNVTILDGITIGDGAVIGAGAVVSKDVPPYAIAYGNPIKIVKYRFDIPTIDKFLKSKWWNWEFERIKEVEKNFFNVEEFINETEL